MLLQNHAWAKKTIQRHTDGFHITENKKFTAMFFYFTLQLTLKELPLVEFACYIKEYPQLSEKAIKVLLSFATTYLCDDRFSSYFNQID